jgi:hypothetical protein
MANHAKRPLVDEAVQDIFHRTLQGISDDFGRLICIASMRDYNTGRYHHEGLALSFASDIAEAALEQCHAEIFQRLTDRPLREFVQQLERYVRSTGEEPLEVINTWRRLEPYRVAVPVACPPFIAEFFFSNTRAALTILHSSHVRSLPDQQFA